VAAVVDEIKVEVMAGLVVVLVVVLTVAAAAQVYQVREMLVAIHTASTRNTSVAAAVVLVVPEVTLLAQ
jgi:multidrug resistance efflux pump